MKRTALAALALAGLACTGEPTPPPVTPAPSVNVTASAKAEPPPAPPAFRLPSAATAKKVAATLRIVPKEDTFSGSVEIDVQVVQPTKVLWLHATELSVREASLEVLGKKLAARVIPGGADFLGFAFDEEIPAGPARFFASYTGKVSDKDDRGVFRETEDGGNYLYTQFETIYARRAFPCFDEPQIKIPWQLTLRVKTSDTAISNTPVIDEKTEGDEKILRFAETKPLPSYLVAFAVGPFDMVDAGRAGKNKTPIRFFVPKGHATEAKFAAGSAGKVLDLLEDAFGIPFPYEKLDYVIIPHLATFGAMENVGLITANAREMLAKPEEDSPLQRRGTVILMAHEAAHQWFGDLVTMAFWDDIWLNEGFATWMETKITSRFDPTFNMDLHSFNHIAWVKGEDGLLSSRKVRQEVASNDDIFNAFDGITYQKGGAVLGMFEGWVGQAAFQKGVRLYLERFAHKNATSNDFLAAVGEGAGRDFKAAFSTFLDQPGVPIVATKLSCDASGAKLSVSAERFLPIGSKGSAAEGTWQIPVCAHYGIGKEHGRTCGLVAGKTGELALPALKGAKGTCPDWVMPNEEGRGYYYSSYSPKEVASLIGKGKAPLSSGERLSVAHDLRALASNGRYPLGEAVGLVADLLKDPSAYVQAAGAMMAGQLRDDYVEPDLRPNARRFANKVLAPRLKELGLVAKASDSAEVRSLRHELSFAMLEIGDDAAVFSEADKLARNWLDQPAAFDPSSAEMVMRLASARGDQKWFDRLVSALKTEKDSRRRRAIMIGLAGFSDPALVKASLSLALGGTLDAREATTLLWAQRHSSRPVVWEWTKANVDKLFSFLPEGMREAVFWIPGDLCDEKQRADVESFLKDRTAQITGSPRALAQTLESISLCVARRDANKESLRAFLKKQ